MADAMTPVFSWLDWSMLILLILSIIVISLESGKKTKNQKDFLLGGKSLKPGMVGLSLFATMTSTLGYLSFPGEMIKYGPIFLMGVLAYPVAGWIINKAIIPKIIRYNVTSAYEILEIKAGKKSRTLAILFFISLRFLWMCTIVFATVKTAIIPIIGLPTNSAPLLCAIIILFTVLFTTIGGLKAVVATDALLALAMFLGAIITIVVILFKLGSLDVITSPDLYAHWVKMDFAPRLQTRMTVSNIILMTLCWQVCTAGSDQMAIQRFLSVKDARQAKRSNNVSLFSISATRILLSVVGLLVMAYFFSNPGQMEKGTTIFSAADNLFPLFIRIGLPSGITGLICAALVAAAVSSLSSGLNSVTSVIQEDILKPIPRFKDKVFTLKDVRWISIILGIAVLGGSFLVGYVQGNLLDITMKVVNLFVAPLYILFFMALYSPAVTDLGTVIGALCSLAAAIAVSFFGILGITQTWNIFIALSVGIPAGILASWIHSRITSSHSIT